MKTTPSLHALFASLVVGCGPIVTVDDTGDDGSSATGDTTGTSDPTATASTTSATTVTTDPTFDSGCSNEFFVDIFELPRSVLEEWIDEDGQIRPGDCWAACQEAGLYEEVLSCQLIDVGTDTGATGGPVPPEPTTTDASTTTNGTDGDTWGTGGSTGGDDPLVVLECEWTYFCGGGRGHEALQSPSVAEGDDPVGRWAAATAHAEAASVTAFLALRRELAAHGAPEALLERTREAARDEVAHARMMRGVATRRGAAVSKPRFGPLRIRMLEEIAIENAVEGCVRETWAALEATYQALHATDPDIGVAMGRIAEDETRHAELALDIDAWIRPRLDPSARARVDRARRHAVADLLAAVARDREPALAQRAGLPTARAAQHLSSGLHRTLWS